MITNTPRGTPMPNAHTEYGRICLAFDQLHIPTLNESLLHDYHHMAKALVKMAQCTGDQKKLDFADNTLQSVRLEMIFRGITAPD